MEISSFRRKLGKFFTDILTEDDNKTFCIVRVSCFFSLIILDICVLIDLLQDPHKIFQPINYATASGSLITLHSGAIFIKGKGNPTKTDDLNEQHK